MACALMSLRRIIVATLSINILCPVSFAQAQSIVTDVQDRSIIDKLDKLKQRDAAEAQKYEQEQRLKRYPLVVFIPGILGSKIEECDKEGTKFVNCTPIWGQKDWSDGFRTKDLSVKSNKHYTTSVLDNFKALRNEIDFYGEGLAFINQMVISETGSLIPYSYDWRQDNRLGALSLQQFLCDLPEVQKARPMVFVAHSMGGLILKYWFSRIYQSEKCSNGSRLDLNIEEAMFLGTPHYGAPEAIRAFADGFKLDEDGSGVFGIVKTLYKSNTIEKELNRFGTMFPSAYQLLPIYGDACTADQRGKIQMQNPIETKNGGIFDLFSPRAWQEVRWPKHIPSNIGESVFLLCF